MGDAYVRQIEILDRELAKLNSRTRDLRQKRANSKEKLSKWMERHALEEYQGYKREKLVPKKIVRKKAKEKERDAIKLFEDLGAPNPRELWLELKKTQTYPKVP